MLDKDAILRLFKVAKDYDRPSAICDKLLECGFSNDEVSVFFEALNSMTRIPPGRISQFKLSKDFSIGGNLSVSYSWKNDLGSFTNAQFNFHYNKQLTMLVSQP